MASSADCNYVGEKNRSVKIIVNNKLQVSATGTSATTNKYSNYKYKIIFDEANVISSDSKKISMPETLYFFWYPSASYNSSTTWYIGLYKDDIKKAAKLADREKSDMKSLKLKKDKDNCTVKNDSNGNNSNKGNNNSNNGNNNSVNEFETKTITSNDVKYCNYVTEDGEKVILTNQGYVYTGGAYSQEVASQNSGFAASNTLKKSIFKKCPKKLYYSCETKNYTGFCTIYSKENSRYGILKYVDDEKTQSAEEVVEQQKAEEEGFKSVDESEKSKGCNVFGDKTTDLLKKLYNLLKIGAPLLVVVMGILDFVKSLLAGDDKGFNEAWQRFLKRLISAVIILLLPVLIMFVLNLSGVLKQYGIEGEGTDIYCIFK